MLTTLVSAPMPVYALTSTALCTIQLALCWCDLTRWRLPNRGVGLAWIATATTLIGRAQPERILLSSFLSILLTLMLMLLAEASAGALGMGDAKFVGSLFIVPLATDDVVRWCLVLGCGLCLHVIVQVHREAHRLPLAPTLVLTYWTLPITEISVA